MPKPRINVTDELMASLEQAVAIVEGTLSPGRIHEVDVPEVDVRAARQRLGMTQTDFAAAFGVALPTLRKWEQRVRRPHGPARVLLRVIEREPEAVRRALERED
jgi:putative transcriptional regulator